MAKVLKLSSTLLAKQMTIIDSSLNFFLIRSYQQRIHARDIDVFKCTITAHIVGSVCAADFYGLYYRQQ